MRLKYAVIGFLLIAIFALGLHACNTIQGLGKDIESLGKTGEDVIKDAKD